MSVAELKSIAKYFQYPLGKISLTDDNVMQMELPGNKGFIRGFSSILNHIHNDLTKGKQQDIVEHYLSKQFFDFSNLFLNFTCRKDKFAACLELNEYLARRSYIMGQNISIVDLVVFYAMKNVMKQFSTLDKESFINLSRYYDHIQQLENVESDESVNFLTLHL